MRVQLLSEGKDRQELKFKNQITSMQAYDRMAETFRTYGDEGTWL